MTGTTFASLVRKYTRTNSTTLPNSDILLWGNVAKDDIAALIQEAKEDEFVIPAKADLVEDQREYPFPTDILGSISRLEVKFATGGEYVEVPETQLELIDLPHNEEDITASYSNEEGENAFDIRRKSIYLYSGSIVDVTDGLRLWFSAYPQDLADADLGNSVDLSISKTTTSVALPRMFHELWARRVSILWKQSKEKPIALSERELKFDIDLENMISAYVMGNTDRVVSAPIPKDTHLQA